jgi:ABC-type transporter Mla MlaB component
MKLEGSFTVEYSRRHKEALIGAIHSARAESRDLEIDVSGIDAIDIAGMQILISLVRECRESSIPLRFRGTPAPAARQRLQDAGLIETGSGGAFALIPELGS